MLTKLTAYFDSLGISPKVAYPFLLGIVGIVGIWIATGEFNTLELRLLAADFFYALIGVAAPPAQGIKQRNV